MNNLFNTPFEAGLRALLILYAVQPQSISIDRITAYDFITVYGKEFGVSSKNLHGDNSLSFSELASKRTVCANGIKSFVLDGLAEVNRTSEGFLYRINSNGIKYVQSLESDYSRQFLDIIRTVHTQYAEVNDMDLIKEINSKAVQALRR